MPAHRTVSAQLWKLAPPTKAFAMAPKAIALKQLQKIAVVAAVSLSKQFGQTVRCKYLGQLYGPRSRPKYRSDPETWVVEDGERHSQTVITFAFQRGGDDAEWTTREVACHHALARGVPAPEAWLEPSMTLAELEKLASAASKRLSKEFDEAVLCNYRGQRHGSDDDPEYRRNPSE